MYFFSCLSGEVSSFRVSCYALVYGLALLQAAANCCGPNFICKFERSLSFLVLLKKTFG